MKTGLHEVNEDLQIKMSVKSIIDTPVQWHDSLEIIYVLEGSIYIEQGAETLLIKANDIEIINPNEIHRLYKTEEDNKILFLQLDANLCNNYCEDIHSEWIYCHSVLHEDENKENFHLLREFIAKMVWEMNEQDEDYMVRVKNTTRRLVLFIVENFSIANAMARTRLAMTNLKTSEEVKERYRRIFTYLRENFTQKISLHEIAENEHLSVPFLSADIKEKLGYSFQEIMNILRVEKGQRLLLSTDRRISEIALDCGFSDFKYLNKNFNKYYDATPSEYRKKHKMKRNELENLTQSKDCPLNDAVENLQRFLYKKYDEITQHSCEEIEVDINMRGEGFEPHWNELINIGNVKKFFLRSANKEQLREIQEDIGFRYVKITQLFNKEWDIFFRQKNIGLNYYWNNIDEVLSYFLKMNCKPYIVLDEIPSSEKKCISLIKSFLSHCTEVYGLNEVETWRFGLPQNHKENVHIITTQVNLFSEKIQVVLENNTDVNRNFLCDTIFMAPYIIHNAKEERSVHSIHGVDSLDYQNEYVSNCIFHGGSGLVTVNGLKKASYYGYYLLSHLGNELIKKDNGYIITRNNEDIQILIYNYQTAYDGELKEKIIDDMSFKDIDFKEINVNIKNLNGNYRIERYHLSGKNGSVFHYWTAMGEPEYLSKSQKDKINRFVVPKVSVAYSSKKYLNLHVELELHSVELIILTKTD